MHSEQKGGRILIFIIPNFLIFLGIVFNVPTSYFVIQDFGVGVGNLIRVKTTLGEIIFKIVFSMYDFNCREKTFYIVVTE